MEPVENVATLDGLDGLLLAGGSDVDPARYGVTRGSRTGPPDSERDRLEAALVAEALERDLPVLAICRGLQLLNVALGGTLVQHVEGHQLPDGEAGHPVAIVPGSRLQEILGVEEYSVNSRHHQCADRLAGGLEVAARAPDGVIEALELPGKSFVLAVQWHPEDRAAGLDGRLFEAFRDAMTGARSGDRLTPAAPGQKWSGRRD